jgi:acyl-[acyl-carrier-protein]-phospholipid O-acyltransferase/long-chain-fatty-acid--[acyl-carrier-protein] ligase
MIAGAYVLPLYTNMQYFSPAHYRSRIIAANNIINSFFILGGIFFIMLLSFLGFSVASILLMACLCNFLVALYIFKLNSAKGLWKKKIVRKIFRGLLRLLYSVEIKGLENFNREKKGAIIICNHFSFIDPTLLATYVSENIIFGIYTTYHKAWWMQPFLRLIKTIPIDPYNSFGIKNLIKIAASGHNVGIFPEGRISTTGNLMKIYGGPAMIAARTHGTILPIVISGADKTYFTRYKLQKLKFFPKITITIFPSININELVADNDRLALMRAMSKIMYETIIMAHHDDNSSSLSHALTIAEEACGSSHVILQDHKKQFNYHSLNNIVGQVANSLLNVIKYQSNVAVLLDNSLDSIIFFLALEKLNCKILLLEHELSLEQKASFLKEHGAANLFIADHIYKSSDHIAEFFVAKGFVCSAIGEIIKVGKKHYSALRLGNVASKIYNAKDVRIFFASGDKLLGFSWRDIKFAINIFRVKYPFSYKDITFHNISLSNYYGLVYATILPLISGMRIFSHNIYNKQSLIAEVIYDNGPTVIFSDNNRLNYYIANSQNYDFYKTSIIFVNNVDLATKEAWDIKYSHSLMNIYTSDLGIVVAANNSFSYHKDSLGAILPFFTITNEKELHINRPLISKIILLGGQSVEMNSYSYKLSSSLRISEDGNIFQG